MHYNVGLATLNALIQRTKATIRDNNARKNVRNYAEFSQWNSHSYRKTRIIIVMVVRQTGQVPPSAATLFAQLSQKRSRLHGTNANQSRGATRQTSQLPCLQHLSVQMSSLWKLTPVSLSSAASRRRCCPQHDHVLTLCVSHVERCTVWRVQLFMAALCNRAGHYIFVLWFLFSSSSSLFFFFFPRLISAVAGWMSDILPHMVWP